MQKWDRQEVKFLADNLNLNTKEIYLRFCDEYGSDIRSYDSIQKKVKKLREAYSDDEDPDDPQSEELSDRINELLHSVPQELVVPDANALRKRELKDEARWWLEGIIEATREQVIPPVQVPQGTESTLCVLISDMHVGKQNKYFNLEIAKQRIRQIPAMIAEQEGTDKIDEVCLMYIGDLVEGEDIFQTQAHHIECSAIEQIITATEANWDMILSFQNIFNCPVRVETVPGNHGRTSKSANEKTNWDNVIYHMLRFAASNYGDSNIIVNANFDFFNTFRVKDKVGMLNHQGVKHAGTPAMREKVAGWSARKRFDFMCHGHWHEWHVGNWLDRIVVCNGCLCGPDDLAERMAKEDTARQAYFFVTPGKPLRGFGLVEWPTDVEQATT